jgi:hypothetical protein
MASDVPPLGAHRCRPLGGRSVHGGVFTEERRDHGDEQRWRLLHRIVGGIGDAAHAEGATTSAGGASGAADSRADRDAGTPDHASTDPCTAPGLLWKTANKTNYLSYPAPASDECIRYNRCAWAGQFAACDGKKTEVWVAAHAIAAVFPSSLGLSLRDLCLRSGDRTLVVTVYDTCSDSDCSGCCSANRGRADALIDLESYTNTRWGVEDGPIQWADLGPTRGPGCR